MEKRIITDSILLKFLNSKKEFIVKRYKPIKFILFGSRVWGEPEEYSDIDMILVSNKFKGENFSGRMGKILNELRFSEHIDALCYTQEEFDKKLKESFILRDAVKKGYNVI